MAERLTKVAIVDVYQYGKVIFTGNSYEVKEHFEFTQKQFNRIRAMGEAVLKGTKPREKTMYAIKIGEEMAAKQVYFIQNSADNPLGFSEVNVIPHSKDAMEFLGIKEWTEEAIEHIESKFPDWIPLIEEKKGQMSLFDEVSE